MQLAALVFAWPHLGWADALAVPVAEAPGLVAAAPRLAGWRRAATATGGWLRVPVQWEWRTITDLPRRAGAPRPWDRLLVPRGALGRLGVVEVPPPGCAAERSWRIRRLDTGEELVVCAGTPMGAVAGPPPGDRPPRIALLHGDRRWQVRLEPGPVLQTGPLRRWRRWRALLGSGHAWLWQARDRDGSERWHWRWWAATPTAGVLEVLPGPGARPWRLLVEPPGFLVVRRRGGGWRLRASRSPSPGRPVTLTLSDAPSPPPLRIVPWRLAIPRRAVPQRNGRGRTTP